MKKGIIYLIIGLLLIGVSFIFKSKEKTAIEDSIRYLVSFEDVKSDNTNSYIYTSVVDSKVDDYFIVYINDGLYVVKSNGLFEESVFKDRNTKVIGKSIKFDESLKEKIINAYNNKFENDEESKILFEDFNKYFGEYYLNVNEVVNDNTLYKTPYMLFKLFINIGFTFIIIFVFIIITNKKSSI